MGWVIAGLICVAIGHPVIGLILIFIGIFT